MFRMDKLIKDIVEKKVRKIINLDKNIIINNDEDLALYGMDSFLFIKLIVEIEEYYSITYPDEMLDFECISTIRKIVDSLKKIMGKNIN